MRHENTPRGGLYVIWLSETHYYGGRTSDFDRRWREHRCAFNAGTHNPKAQAAFNKYGGFRPEILVHMEDGDDLEKAEQDWLDDNVGKPGCVNLNPLATGGSYEWPPEARAAVSERMRGNQYALGLTHSPETRAKMSKSSQGQVPWNLGVPCTEETREKLRQANTGKKHSEETKDKIRKALTGRKLSDETKRKIGAANAAYERTESHRRKLSEAGKGRHFSPETREKLRQANTGKKHSEEARRKMREAWKRRKEKMNGLA